ncbi:MAG: chemotaxis protein CheW [Acidiferrobacteraceae bacterium]
MSSPRSEGVHALIIPLQESVLLVPSAMIAEVVPLPQRLVPIPLSEPWLLGVFGWRLRPVPVVSFNRLLGAEEPPASRRSRLVVFYSLPGRAAGDFFAVLSALEPQPRLLEDGQEFSETRTGPEGIALMTRLGTLKALIPDLDALTKRFYPPAVA